MTWGEQVSEPTNGPATRSDVFNTIHDWLADHILLDEPRFRHMQEIEVLCDRLGWEVKK